ncbi:hypothetical protein KUCAC02_023146 [Chaenocephalus aceratus]|uniref:Uncharacterized protein n=1 Tax=Chaenocephalus aceratus TaxID=36190 RepID=A0ACB9XP45_CHAAC|nr:hypothetical protein KUCAC02_023146 [Chaenocephalus aceratus]
MHNNHTQRKPVAPVADFLEQQGLQEELSAGSSGTLRDWPAVSLYNSEPVIAWITPKLSQTTPARLDTLQQ